MTGPVKLAVQNADFEAIYAESRREIISLRCYFLRKHLNTRAFAGPARYGRDVKAFCVLSHAALEQCFEDVALATVLWHVDAYLTKRTTSATLLALLAYHGKAIASSNDQSTLVIRSYDVNDQVLENAKRSFSKVVADNNGIFFPYLASLLSPAAIDLQPSVDELNAISRLKSERGHHAHNSIAQQILSPEDASRHVYRCLAVASDVAVKGATSCGKPTQGIRRVRIPYT